jgi:hypothetical protein
MCARRTHAQVIRGFSASGGPASRATRKSIDCVRDIAAQIRRRVIPADTINLDARAAVG